MDKRSAMKRRHSPDVLEDSEQPVSPSVLQCKQDTVKRHRPECSHCNAIKKEETDRRNDIFGLLIKGKHSAEVPLADSELHN
ncbi:unnamed protein product, partial [Iphiclides podalirius]